MEFRSARVLVGNTFAGSISETDSGYRFEYAHEYLAAGDAEPISLTMPLRAEPYTSKVLFPFFDGLIPEGWLLAVAEKTWKLDPRDRMGLLLACCRECIGNVSIVAGGKPE
ncbi:MAG TPA: HipA N-terminal domain-containing protein [Fibrobacteria bacterium]|nr:HipA N-terminal domain-containing protein [Fibrobacteria bacterium]